LPRGSPNSATLQNFLRIVGASPHPDRLQLETGLADGARIKQVRSAHAREAEPSAAAALFCDPVGGEAGVVVGGGGRAQRATGSTSTSA
jgi:hypothetical protein